MHAPDQTGAARRASNAIMEVAAKRRRREPGDRSFMPSTPLIRPRGDHCRRVDVPVVERCCPGKRLARIIIRFGGIVKPLAREGERHWTVAAVGQEAPADAGISLVVGADGFEPSTT